MTTATATKTKAKTAKSKVPAEAPATEVVEPLPAEKIKTLKFPVIAGIQAGKQNYTTMIPLRMLAKLFPHLTFFPSQKDIPIEERYQRDLDPTRAKSIARYVANGMKDDESYVLGAVSASIEVENWEFRERFSGSGVLSVDASAVFRLRDGQHRIRGLILSVEKDPAIGNETIPIVFYHFVGFEDEQQAFSDQNRLVRPAPKSLTMAFNWRDEDVARTREILENLTQLKLLIDYDRSKCRKGSNLLFSLQEFHRAMQIMSHDMKEEAEGFVDFAAGFWRSVLNLVYDDIRTGRRHAESAREISIAPTMLTLEAIALQGMKLRDETPEVAAQSLGHLTTFDWAKTNSAMLAVCAPNGKITKNAKTVEALRSLIFDQGEF